MKKLMGLLAIGMQMSVVTAMVGASSFTIKEKENIVSAISFLLLLKRRKGTNATFLEELKRLLSICDEQELLAKISGCEGEYPDLLSEDTEQSGAVESVGYDFEPTQNQRHRFKGVLYEISQSIGKRDLEILVALAPIPEAGKENIEVGYELFHRMESHGCIGENDTELLQEMLELLKLRAALQILLKYQREFSPSSSTCTGDDDLSHPIQEMNQDSSTESGNENGSLGFRHIWNMICTKLSSVASTLSSSRSSHVISCVQPEVGTSIEILSPSSFSPKEQPLPHSLDGLDSSNDSCSRDLDANCDPTSNEDSEIKLMTKSLPKRKRPCEDDNEQYPVEEGSDDGGSCDLVDSPPPAKTLCVASISVDDSVTVLPNAGHSASQFNDEADTWHWKMQSLQVNFSSTTNGYRESESDPQESTSSLGYPNQR
jgi:hypothetical protein